MTVSPTTPNVQVSQTAIFTAEVAGVRKENFTYQWKQRGVDIPGETDNTLTITGVTESDSGSYECIVSNEYGDCDRYCVELQVTGLKNYRYSPA